MTQLNWRITNARTGDTQVVSHEDLTDTVLDAELAQEGDTWIIYATYETESIAL